MKELLVTKPDSLGRRSSARRWFALSAAVLAICTLAISLSLSSSVAAKPSSSAAKRDQATATIVLVHGARADSSSWSKVVRRLQARGYTVDVPPNPLRGLGSDSASITSFLNTITGPVVLVDHAYGGAVITNAATGVRTSRPSCTSTRSRPIRARTSCSS